MKQSTITYPEIPDVIVPGSSFVLATVVETYGSTPQKPGSLALIGPDGLYAGTVGGGITESKIVDAARILMRSGRAQLLSFNLSGEIEQGSESVCGGGMMILLDSKLNTLLDIARKIRESLRRNEQGVLLTRIEKSDEPTVTRYWISPGEKPRLLAFIEEKIGSVIQPATGENVDSTQLVELRNSETNQKEILLIERLSPKPALVIAGAGHIGKALVCLGKMLGFRVIIWDDRPEYLKDQTLASADVVVGGSIERAVAEMPFGANSFLVIVTRGHKSDAEVLKAFLPLPKAYLGMIGSKAKVAQMREFFLKNKWATDEEWARIHAPIGLSIGAATVEEIAVSIAAELIQVKNQKR